MSNLKNVIIYLLSVLIAFESGVLLFIVGMFTVKEIEPAMALSFYSRLDTVRRLP